MDAQEIVAGLGGADNIVEIEPCTTRLRAEVRDPSLVDEAAVASALDAGHLGGYAADAFEMEDWARADRPPRISPVLLAHQRTVFTPHLGSAVSEVRRQIVLQAAQSLAEFFAGRPMAGRL